MSNHGSRAKWEQCSSPVRFTLKTDVPWKHTVRCQVQAKHELSIPGIEDVDLDAGKHELTLRQDGTIFHKSPGTAQATSLAETSTGGKLIGCENGSVMTLRTAE
jgi:hypothetical protein